MPRKTVHQTVRTTETVRIDLPATEPAPVRRGRPPKSTHPEVIADPGYPLDLVDRARCLLSFHENGLALIDAVVPAGFAVEFMAFYRKRLGIAN